MFDSLSIRLKIVLLSGLCLLGVVALIVGMNIYQTNQNDDLVSDSSSRMLTTVRVSPNVFCTRTACSAALACSRSCTLAVSILLLESLTRSSF